MNAKQLKRVFDKDEGFFYVVMMAYLVILLYRELEASNGDSLHKIGLLLCHSNFERRSGLRLT